MDSLGSQSGAGGGLPELVMAAMLVSVACCVKCQVATFAQQHNSHQFLDIVHAHKHFYHFKDSIVLFCVGFMNYFNPVFTKLYF